MIEISDEWKNRIKKLENDIEKNELLKEIKILEEIRGIFEDILKITICELRRNK